MTEEGEGIMDLVSVLEDRVTEWARGATPESRSIRADKTHAAQTAVHSAIRAALASPTTLVVPADVLDVHRNWTDTTWAVRVRWSRKTGSVLGTGDTAERALIDARRLAAIYDDAPDPSAVGPQVAS